MLKGKVCLVTGAGKGIGKAVSELFVRNHALVYANARNEGCLDEWADDLNNQNTGKVIPIYFDITDSAAIRNAVSRIKKETACIDVLVNNAGMVTNELFGTISIDTMKSMFNVNVFGLMELTQYVGAKIMMKQKHGSIINMASAVAVEGCSGQVAYSASKGAVISLTKSLAKELAQYNVRVNAVAPGMIATERILKTIDEVYKGVIPNIGMGRLGEPIDVAELCLFLASDASSYVTGQVIETDGGIHY